MPMQKIEFEFPDEVDEKIEVEPSSMETIDLKNPQSHLEKKEEEKVEVKTKEPDIDLEIVDDTPEEDRGREPSEPPEDPTDEELENYSSKVRKRIKHFTKGYHDERRAKEAAIREREEAERALQGLLQENQVLKENGNKSQTALLNQAKQSADRDYKAAQALYKKAYDDGDSGKVLEAQEKLTDAKLKVEKLSNYKLPALQRGSNTVNTSTNTSEPVNTASNQADAPISVDERAVAWGKENKWFGKDHEMTGYAHGLHQKLVSQGVDTKSDEYYEAIDSRMRTIFPDKFDAPENKPRTRQSNDNVVAPATRSTSPKKVKLTPSQVRLSKRIGLTPEQYAQQLLLEMRK